MDAYEATRVVYSRIQNLDPENASKVMGLLLIQDHGEKEMIRLAFGPESLVHSVILKAKKDLGLSSSSNTPSTPSTPLSFTNSISLSRHNSSNSSASSRLLNGINLPSPLSIPNLSTSNSSWAAASNFSEDLVSPNSGPNHYNFTSSNGAIKLGHGSSSSSTMNSSAPPFYGSGESENDLIDEYQLQDQLSFLNEGPKSPDFYYPQSDLAPANWAGSVNGLHHRRSCSVTDICLGSEDPTGGFWWKPCLYYARGYCKNGTSCRFLHVGLSDSDGDGSMVGSQSKMEMMEQCHELLRSKSAQQQRLAAVSQLMAGSNSPYSPSKCMNFLLQQQNDSPRGAAGLMMADEMNKFARSPRFERSDFSMNGGMGMVNSVSRQIYLTFPADSTFREEDVSNYFSIYGPVQDVRIPYQQKRMFGFVTFVYPETVKIILAKGNPHFVCDARVLVKPYKEKGKIPDKFRKQQLMERGEFPACGSPTSLDSRDPFDLQLGPRMLYNSQDLLWRRKLEEQADLEQAIELQNRRLMGLQLLDLKRSHHHRALSTGAAISSPTHSPNFYHQSLVLPSSNRSSPEFPEENGTVSALANNAPVTINEQPANVNEKEKDSSNLNDQNTNGKASPHHDEESDLQESLEHNLPENLFASPKAAGEDKLAFTIDTVDAEKKRAMVSIATPSSANNNLMASSLLPATSTLDMASLNSCYFQAPRFTSSHGAMGM